MNGEWLFRVLGLVDDDLIEEADRVSHPVGIRKRFLPPLAAAACVVLLSTVAVTWLLRSFSCGSIAPAEGESSDASAPQAGGGTSFLSYAGPVFPLSAAQALPALRTERTITWDFSPQTGSGIEGAAVKDAYALTNHSPATVSASFLYPFAGSLDQLYALQPAVAVNDTPPETTLYAGSMAGSFQQIEINEDAYWDFQPSACWQDYQTLLADGSYLSHALDTAPVLDPSVTVYAFTDCSAPCQQYDAATQAVSFTIDPQRTTILSYGFNGLQLNTNDPGFRQYNFFVPDGRSHPWDPAARLLIVLGDDIGPYTLQGYANGGCAPQDEINGVSCTVSRYETTLDAVLDEICASYLQQRTIIANAPDVPSPLFQRAVTELLLQRRVLSDPSGNHTGQLEDILQQALYGKRIFYLSFSTTIPAEDTAHVTIQMHKEPSFDYSDSSSETAGLQGYDLMTTLGSPLEFTAQSAAVTHFEHLEIAQQNFGFDISSDILEVPLQPDSHYYLEIQDQADE